MFETTPESVSLKARCAPMTSLLSRLTRAPVLVRVKKATGIRWTWSKTARRRSRMRPSPMFDDSHRTPDSGRRLGDGDQGDRHRDSDDHRLGPTGGDEVDDSSGEQRRHHGEDRGEHRQHQEQPDPAPMGLANPPIRRSVARRSPPRNRLPSGEVDDLYIMSQATDSMLMSPRVELKVHLRSNRARRPPGGRGGESHRHQCSSLVFAVTTAITISGSATECEVGTADG